MAAVACFILPITVIAGAMYFCCWPKELWRCAVTSHHMAVADSKMFFSQSGEIDIPTLQRDHDDICWHQETGKSSCKLHWPAVSGKGLCSPYARETQTPLTRDEGGGYDFHGDDWIEAIFGACDCYHKLYWAWRTVFLRMANLLVMARCLLLDCFLWYLTPGLKSLKLNDIVYSHSTCSHWCS